MNSAELSPRRRRRRFLVGYGEGELTVPVKREPEEDIKDYAETTMNELLGWYGYEKVDSRDTQGLNLTHFAGNNNNNLSTDVQGPLSNDVSPPSSALEGSDGSEDAPDGTPRLRPGSVSPGPDASSAASDEVARQHQQMVSALSTITKHPGAPDSPNPPPGCIVCAWCQKVGMKLFTLKTPNGCKAFCSELCFTQCRRASFKKNKICDWCKHVRHTVNYVDFQDGEQQLQFCSDKCLNQYKMNIFCRETQAHLQMHTHLKEAACKMAASGSSNLITPDLWLRDCNTNGSPSSPPRDIDVGDDLLHSDDNLSAAASPIPESPVVPSPPEIKEQKQESPEVVDKDLPNPGSSSKPPRKSSKHSPKKSSHEKIPHMKGHKEKKPNGISIANNDIVAHSRRSPIQASPPAHYRNSMPVNGSQSLLSPPPLNAMSRPPPHMGLPPRHCPPVPSPIGVGALEHRKPFFPHSVMPPPFQLLAQQQMEAFLRTHHGLDLRSKLPPPLPLPPWGMPPYSHPRPPPHFPLPPMSSKNPPMPHAAPSNRNNHHQNPVKPGSHQTNKHKHSRHASGHHTSNKTPPKGESDLTMPIPSQLPPVTVMVPFPLVLPVPLPVPIPLPIPPDIMEKYSRKVGKVASKTLNGKLEQSSYKKRKNLSELPKHKKKKRVSASAVGNDGVGHHAESVPKDDHAQRESNRMIPDVFEVAENLILRNTPTSALKRISMAVAGSRTNHAMDSRSYSPLSEGLSSNEEENNDGMPRNGDVDRFPGINFSNFNLNLVRSSPFISSRSSDHYPRDFGNRRSLSPPTNLSTRDKHDLMSSTAVSFKKKHLRDQLSLMT